jgi:hypothetical protein
LAFTIGWAGRFGAGVAFAFAIGFTGGFGTGVGLASAIGFAGGFGAGVVLATAIGFGGRFGAGVDLATTIGLIVGPGRAPRADFAGGCGCGAGAGWNNVARKPVLGFGAGVARAVTGTGACTLARGTGLGADAGPAGGAFRKENTPGFGVGGGGSSCKTTGRPGCCAAFMAMKFALASFSSWRW